MDPKRRSRRLQPHKPSTGPGRFAFNFSHRSPESKQADLVTTSVDLLGTLQILENWLKSGFAVFFAIADVRHQERNAGEFLIVLAIGDKVLSWVHEGKDFLRKQSLEGNHVSLGACVAGACFQDAVGVQAFDYSGERLIITSR